MQSQTAEEAQVVPVQTSRERVFLQCPNPSVLNYVIWKLVSTTIRMTCHLVEEEIYIRNLDYNPLTVWTASVMEHFLIRNAT